MAWKFTLANALVIAGLALALALFAGTGCAPPRVRPAISSVTATWVCDAWEGQSPNAQCARGHLECPR